MSELTEIARLCALESEIKIVAIIAPQAKGSKVLGEPAAANVEAVSGDCDSLILTVIDAHLDNVKTLKDSDRTVILLLPLFLERSLFEVDKQTARRHENADRTLLARRMATERRTSRCTQSGASGFQNAGSGF